MLTKIPSHLKDRGNQRNVKGTCNLVGILSVSCVYIYSLASDPSYLAEIQPSLKKKGEREKKSDSFLVPKRAKTQK